MKQETEPKLFFTRKMLKHWKKSAVEAMEALSPTCTQDVPAQQIVNICETALQLLEACEARDKAAGTTQGMGMRVHKECGYCGAIFDGVELDSQHFQECPRKTHSLSLFRDDAKPEPDESVDVQP
jgi:hypothetical protein